MTSTVHNRASLVAQTLLSACNAGDSGSILGLGRSPGEGNGYYSCLENSMGRGALAGYSPWSPRVGHDWQLSLSFIYDQQIINKVLQ